MEIQGVNVSTRMTLPQRAVGKISQEEGHRNAISGRGANGWGAPQELKFRTPRMVNGSTVDVRMHTNSFQDRLWSAMTGPGSGVVEGWAVRGGAGIHGQFNIVLAAVGPTSTPEHAAAGGLQIRSLNAQSG